MKTWPKVLSYLAIAGIVTFVAYFAFRETPILVDVAEVKKGPMQVTISEEGVTRVRNVYQVFPTITGHLSRITLEEGDKVIAHETVVGRIHPLDPPFIDLRTANEIAAAVDAARASVTLAEVGLSRAQTDLSLAEIEFQRSLELKRNDVVSQAELDKRENVVMLRRAEVESAKAAINLKKAELKSIEARQVQPTSVPTPEQMDSCCIEIKAPVSGTVLKIIHKSEQVIQSIMPIMEIGNPKDLEIAIDLLSSDAVKIKPGSSVIISEWGGDKPLKSSVRRIDPAGFTKISALGIEEQRVNVVLDMDNIPDSIGHGYRVYANFVVWSSEDALQIPIGALFRNNGKWAAFVVNQDRVLVKEITLGEMNDSHAQVLAGLEAGDQIVLYPNDQLQNSALVKQRQLAK